MKKIGFIGNGNMGSAIVRHVASLKQFSILLYDVDKSLSDALVGNAKQQHHLILF